MSSFRSPKVLLVLAAMFGLIYAATFVIGTVRKRRHVPGLPDDGEPLKCWEWDEMDLIEEHYGRTP